MEVHGTDVSSLREVNGIPVVVIFRPEQVGSYSYQTGITWRGFDGCSVTKGSVTYRVGTGAFSATGSSTTRGACLGLSYSPPSASGVDVVAEATHVRLVDGDLHFFDAGDRLIGVFEKAAN